MSKLPASYAGIPCTIPRIRRITSSSVGYGDFRAGRNGSVESPIYREIVSEETIANDVKTRGGRGCADADVGVSRCAVRAVVDNDNVVPTACSRRADEQNERAQQGGEKDQDARSGRHSSL